MPRLIDVLQPLLRSCDGSESLRLDDAEATAIFDALFLEERTGDEIEMLLALLELPKAQHVLMSALHQYLWRHAQEIPYQQTPPVLNFCSTGGALMRTFNISTLAAFVTAACGAPTVKHCGFSANNPGSGSMDLLTALSIRLPKTPAEVCEQVQRYGLSFVPAQSFQPLVASIDLALGRQNLARAGYSTTIFNHVLPWSLPVRNAYHVMGRCASAVPGSSSRTRRTVDYLLALRYAGVDGAICTSQQTDNPCLAGNVRCDSTDDGYTTFSPPAEMQKPRALQSLPTDLPLHQAAQRLLQGRLPGVHTESVLFAAATALCMYHDKWFPSLHEEVMSNARAQLQNGAVWAKYEALTR